MLGPTAEESSTKTRAPPFVFKKGHESQVAQQAIERLKCPVQGAVFVKKLVESQQAALNPGAKKKRPVAPELGESQAKKKAKKAPKAKAKSASAGSVQSKAVLQDGETQETLEEDIYTEPGSSAKRQRLWLDDVLAAMMSCSLKPQRPTPSDLLKMPIYQDIVRYALEFCITGEVVLNKKKLTQWSKVRPTLQNMILMSQREAMSEVPKAHDTEEILHKLMNEASAGSSAKGHLDGHTSATASAVGLAKSILQSKEALNGTEVFIKANNGKNIQQHLAYRDYIQRCRTVCCECGSSEWDRKKCEFHDTCSHTFLDLVSGLSHALDFNSEDQHASLAMTPVLTCIGASSVVQGAYLTTEYIRQKKATSTLGTSESGDTVKKNLCPLEIFGKDAKFLLKEVSKDEAPGGWFFNMDLATLLTTCRARYLWGACAELMTRPKFDATSEVGIGNRQFIRFEDLTDDETIFAFHLLKHLSQCEGPDESKFLQFIVHTEARYAFQKPASSSEVNPFWSSMWAEALKTVINKACKSIPRSEFTSRTFDMEATVEPFLPSPQSICPKSLFQGGGGKLSGVKNESSSPSESTAAATTSVNASGAVPVATGDGSPSLPSFHSIHSMQGVQEFKDKAFNVLDVLCLKSAVESHIFTTAACLGRT